MDLRLVWTEKASEDIEAIVRYIARHNTRAAMQIGLEVYERVQILQTYPEAGSILEELGDPHVRKIIYKKWKIVYQNLPQEELIVILRVWPVLRGEVEI